jgi:ABC-type uncharacterized transport system permease subunit
MIEKERTRNIFIITFVIITLIIVITGSLEHREKFRNIREISKSDLLDTTYVTIENEEKEVILLKDSLMIFSHIGLIENYNNFNDWKSLPIITLSSKKHKYTLMNVPYPYIIFKGINSDTVIVIKDTFELKFKLNKFKKD